MDMLEANKQLLSYVAKLTTQLKEIKSEKENLVEAQTLKPEVVQAIETAIQEAKEVLGEE